MKHSGPKSTALWGVALAIGKQNFANIGAHILQIESDTP